MTDQKSNSFIGPRKARHSALAGVIVADSAGRA